MYKQTLILVTSSIRICLINTVVRISVEGVTEKKLKVTFDKILDSPSKLPCFCLFPFETQGQFHITSTVT